MEIASRIICWNGQREAEKSKIYRLLQDEVYLVRDGEKITFPRLWSDLRGNVILEETLPFVSTMFSLFVKDSLASFAGLLMEMLREKGFDAEDTEVKLNFLRIGYVLG